MLNYTRGTNVRERDTSPCCLSLCLRCVIGYQHSIVFPDFSFKNVRSISALPMWSSLDSSSLSNTSKTSMSCPFHEKENSSLYVGLRHLYLTVLFLDCNPIVRTQYGSDDNKSLMISLLQLSNCTFTIPMNSTMAASRRVGEELGLRLFARWILCGGLDGLPSLLQNSLSTYLALMYFSLVSRNALSHVDSFIRSFDCR